MRSPLKNWSSAAGIFTFQKICQREARMVRMRSIRSGSTERNPPTRLTVMGKNVEMTTSTTFGARP